MQSPEHEKNHAWMPQCRRWLVRLLELTGLSGLFGCLLGGLLVQSCQTTGVQHRSVTNMLVSQAEMGPLGNALAMRALGIALTAGLEDSAGRSSAGGWSSAAGGS